VRAVLAGDLFLLRTMEVSRDETSLAASPGLWPAIQAALDASR
jgi:hypothetical protein